MSDQREIVDKKKIYGCSLGRCGPPEKSIQRRSAGMDIGRQLGILVFCGVPAIVGGGIVYAIFGSYPPVCVYETLLILVAGGIIRK